MAAAPKNVDINLVRKLTPLDTLTLPKVEEILAKSAVQKIPVGRVLFKEGDRDKWTVYLLTGTIELSSEDGKSENIKPGTNIALKPLAKGTPRPLTATAKTEVSVLIIDTELLDIMVNWNAPGSIEVSDFDSEDEDEDDWMTKFLNSNAFIQLPTSNMQALMMKLEEMPMRKGKMVIKEGDSVDNHYYIIKQGQCIVSRKDEKTGKQIPLAILKTGVGFGEEALITGAARGATVSMKSDGIVLKLVKEDFIELLAKPLIHFITDKEIEAVSPSDIVYIDVRNKLEHKANGIEGSIHCPIQTIREKITTLDPEQHYIVYSNEENRASSAAFLFIQQGYEVSVLRKGVGKPNIDEVLLEAAEAEENTDPENAIEITTSTEAVLGNEPKVNNDNVNNELAQCKGDYEKQLAISEQARKKAEEMIMRLKTELQKTREIAQKESKIAKNAVLLARKADARAKQLEAELKELKGS